MRLAVAVVVAFVSGPASAQRNIDPATVDIKTQKLDENVYMLQFLGPAGPAGNVGGNVGAFIGADGIAIVDSGYASVAPKLEAALKAMSDQPVRYVLNTHWHGDHSGADEYFGNRAIIVAHENARRKMLKGGMLFTPSPAAALPAITCADRITVHTRGPARLAREIDCVVTEIEALVAKSAGPRKGEHHSVNSERVTDHAAGPFAVGAAPK